MESANLQENKPKNPRKLRTVYSSERVCTDRLSDLNHLDLSLRWCHMAKCTCNTECVCYEDPYMDKTAPGSGHYIIRIVLILTEV